MSTITSWENIPSEIWFMILEKLPVKSQVSLGCTCNKMYRLSLDPFLNNLEQRAWVYLKEKTSLPDLLAKAVTILRIPAPQEAGNDLEQQSLFLKEEIRRMSNLQRLIIEKDAEKNECRLSFSDLYETVWQQDLAELKVPPPFYTSKFSKGETLLHLAVEKDNVKLVNSLLSQMEVYFQNDGKTKSTTFSALINASDEQGNAPLKIAIEKRNEELILLLLKKGARGKEYLLSRENPDLSPFRQDAIDKGSHLQIDYLNPSDFSAFFEAVANSSSLLSLHFSKEGYREIKKTGLDFFQGLAGALQSNFQRCAALSQADLRDTAKSLSLLILDLRDCEGLTVQETRPLFTCLGLEELWLPTSLIDYLDEQKQNLLHLLVQESPMNTKIAGSLIAQGVALSSRDHKGRSPVELARELGVMPGAREMANFLEQAAKKKLATIAFGKKEWEKYFGKVGKEPPLPIPIMEVLEGFCPIWSGKKVADTHLLTLIPKTLNGEPLTLDYLERLVQSPKGGDNRSEYRYYGDVVKNAIGTKAQDRSYWVLLTKDVLPNTRIKTYQDQCRELENWKQKSPAFKAGGYRVPKALEVAASVLMEHARSGTRFYSDSSGANRRSTYTRCSETSARGAQVLIGDLAASGLDVSDYVLVYDFLGLGAAREVSLGVG